MGPCAVLWRLIGQEELSAVDGELRDDVRAIAQLP